MAAQQHERGRERRPQFATVPHKGTGHCLAKAGPQSALESTPKQPVLTVHALVCSSGPAEHSFLKTRTHSLPSPERVM